MANSFFDEFKDSLRRHFTPDEDESIYEFEDDYEEDELDDISLQELNKRFFYPYIKKIALVGGPCSGKSEMIEIARKKLEEMNIPCFVVSETATELLKGGLSYKDEPRSFQHAVLQLQLNKEDAYKQYVVDYCADKNYPFAVILFDRIAFDCHAYMSDIEWEYLLSDFNLSTPKLCARYGDFSIIHLESASTINKFSKDNNAERYEDNDTAKLLEKRIFDIYRKFAEDYHYITAKEDYQAKIDSFTECLTGIINKCAPKKQESEAEQPQPEAQDDVAAEPQTEIQPEADND